MRTIPELSNAPEFGGASEMHPIRKSHQIAKFSERHEWLSAQVDTAFEQARAPAYQGAFKEESNRIVLSSGLALVESDRAHDSICAGYSRHTGKHADLFPTVTDSRDRKTAGAIRRRSPTSAH